MGASWVVQRLGLRASTARHVGSSLVAELGSHIPQCVVGGGRQARLSCDVWQVRCIKHIFDLGCFQLMIDLSGCNPSISQGRSVGFPFRPPCSLVTAGLPPFRKECYWFGCVCAFFKHMIAYLANCSVIFFSFNLFQILYHLRTYRPSYSLLSCNSHIIKSAILNSTVHFKNHIHKIVQLPHSVTLSSPLSSPKDIPYLLAVTFHSSLLLSSVQFSRSVVSDSATP